MTAGASSTSQPRHGARECCTGWRFAEYELDVGQGFRNTHERSKFEAELVARERAASPPLVMVRLSIVIAHAESGRTTGFNALYGPLRMMLRHAGRVTLPMRRDTPLDTVPVDRGARMILEATLNGRDGRTYAAASGYASLKLQDLATSAAEISGTPPITLLPPGTSDRAVEQSMTAWGARSRSRSQAAVRVWAPYVMSGSRFDTLRGDPSCGRPPWLLPTRVRRCDRASSTLGDQLRTPAHGGSAAAAARRAQRGSGPRPGGGLRRSGVRRVAESHPPAGAHGWLVRSWPLASRALPRVVERWSQALSGSARLQRAVNAAA